jgi:Na+/H+-translocating membrane pyrophosphatase
MKQMKQGYNVPEEGGEMNQRTVALVIVGAITLFLFVAAVVAGLMIGGKIRSVASGNTPLQVHSEQPQSVDELRRSYTLETGSLEVNLQDVEFPEDTTDLEASIENGALTVVVPKGVAVSAHAEVGNGTVSFLGSERTGENLDRQYESEGYDQADHRLSLGLSAGTGVITVVREA